MPDSITIPAAYIGTPDATLTVEPDEYGDRYAMTLTVAGEIVARGEGFGLPAMGGRDFGEGHWPYTAGTFGAFLAHALESSEEDARDGWPILTDAASDWTDALYMYSEELS